MAIVVLVLWLFTAGAGFYLLVTSNLRGARPAPALPVAQSAPDAAPATASVAAPAAQAPAAQAPAARAQPAVKRPSRAARDRFAPPSLGNTSC